MIRSRAGRGIVLNQATHLRLSVAAPRLIWARMASGAVSSEGAPASGVEASYKPRYIDIGINLADPIFRGRYHGKQRHPDDLQAVIQRARDVGCTKLMVTGSSFKSSRDALALTQEFAGTVYSTAGIHPCSSSIFATSHPHHHEADDEEHTVACDPDPSKPITDTQEVDAAKSERIISDLRDFVSASRSSSSSSSSGGLVAFGEFGLDYDRLHYCPKTIQLHSFEAQLAVAASLQPQLPLFLHSRACHADFVRLLKGAFGDGLERLERGGVVHSFTGTVEEMRELMDLGLYIGLNGCSFKTPENCAVVKEVRLDRLMLETDGPWCEVRPSHEGWKYLVEPKSQPVAAAAASASDANTGNAAATAAGGPTKKQGKKQHQQQQQKKKEPDVPERFKTVKKEKWEEGAMVKSRNEPCMIERVAKMVAGIKGVPIEDVCEAAWANTVKVFGLDDKA